MLLQDNEQVKESLDEMEYFEHILSQERRLV